MPHLRCLDLRGPACSLPRCRLLLTCQPWAFVQQEEMQEQQGEMHEEAEQLGFNIIDSLEGPGIGPPDIKKLKEVESVAAGA